MNRKALSSTRNAVAVSLLLLATAPLAQAQPTGSDFDLVCTGTGEKMESHTDYDWDSKHHDYQERTSVGNVQVAGSVQVEIHGGEGRLRLPKNLLPLLTGGEGGWFPIRDLVVSPERIQGSFKINGLNKPKLSIDRRTGSLKIDGSQTFEGSCEPFNPASTKF